MQKYRLFWGFLLISYLGTIGLPPALPVRTWQTVQAETRTAGVNQSALPYDIQKILTRKKLIVGVCAVDVPPFFMTNSHGKLDGFDIRLAKEIATQLGVGVEFNRQAKTYDQLTDQVISGKIDLVISNYSRTFERAKKIRYTRPYIYLRQSLMINRIAAVRQKIEDAPLAYLRANKVKVGVLAGSCYVGYCQELLPNATIILYDTWELVVDAVVKGDVIATLNDDNRMIMLVRQNPNIALYASIYVLKDKKDPIAIGVAWQNTHLLAWLDIYLDTYLNEMDINNLIKEYPEVYREQNLK